MKPRRNYRSRPQKSGAKRNQRIKTQKKRLVEAGYDEKVLNKKNVVEIRELLKEAGKKTSKRAIRKAAAKTAKKPAVKSAVKAVKKPAKKKA